MKENVLKALFLIICFQICEAPAQCEGIRFETHTNWSTVLAKADNENKFIFVDCFTTWCGPCKKMSSQVFTLDSVGRFYNSHFINVKLQLDSTEDDAMEVGNWYSTGREFVDKYPISAYPTYLIFNQNGSLVYTFTGSMEAASFIEEGRKALLSQDILPVNKFYDELKAYRAGERSPAFLYRLVSELIEANNVETNMNIVADYLSTQSDLYKKDNLDILVRLAKSGTDTAFKMATSHPQRVDSILGNQDAFFMVRSIILDEEFGPLRDRQEPTIQDWSLLADRLSDKYPLIGQNVLLYIKYIYYAVNRDWVALAATINSYLHAGRIIPEDFELNIQARNIFQNSDDKYCLKSALNWSKKSFTGKEQIDPGYIDTYANLLYKLGKRKKALKWEGYARKIAISQGADKTWGQDNLSLMKHNKKTWR